MSFFTLRCFQSKEFDGFQTINQFTELPNVPHLLPLFVKAVIQHYQYILKYDSNFGSKATSQAIIQLQMNKRKSFVHVLILCQNNSHSCLTIGKHDCGTVERAWLQEHVVILKHCSMSLTTVAEGCALLNFCFIVSTTVHLSIQFKLTHKCRSYGGFNLP